MQTSPSSPKAEHSSPLDCPCGGIRVVQDSAWVCTFCGSRVPTAERESTLAKQLALFRSAGAGRQ